MTIVAVFKKDVATVKQFAHGAYAGILWSKSNWHPVGLTPNGLISVAEI